MYQGSTNWIMIFPHAQERTAQEQGLLTTPGARHRPHQEHALHSLHAALPHFARHRYMIQRLLLLKKITTWSKN